MPSPSCEPAPVSGTNSRIPQCVDIEFAEPGDPKIALVNETNCYNSTDIGFAEMYTITTREPGVDAVVDDDSAAASLRSLGWTGWLPLLAGGLWIML